MLKPVSSYFPDVLDRVRPIKCKSLQDYQDEDAATAIVPDIARARKALMDLCDTLGWNDGWVDGVDAREYFAGVFEALIADHVRGAVMVLANV